jgi:hypothetical protein
MLTKGASLILSLVLLVFAAFAWYAYLADSMAYGDLLGAPNQGTAAIILKTRGHRLLGLALSAEAIGVASLVWYLAGEGSRSRRILMASLSAVVLSVLTFAIFRL